MALEQAGPASDELRDTVRQLWIEVLGHHDFTDGESFFDVGGHSVRGVLLMKHLEQRLRVALPMSLLFDHQTIESLARAVFRELPHSPTGP